MMVESREQCQQSGIELLQWKIKVAGVSVFAKSGGIFGQLQII